MTPMSHVKTLHIYIQLLIEQTVCFDTIFIQVDNFRSKRNFSAISPLTPGGRYVETTNHSFSQAC